MKVTNANVSITYEEVEFNRAAFQYHSRFNRCGLPIDMNFVLDSGVFMVLEKETEHGAQVGYQLARSTYGKSQHLNFFEQFIITRKGERIARIYAEFANDPHHRIDALKKHQVVAKETHPDEYRAIQSKIKNAPHAKLFEIALEFADGVSFIDGTVQTLGLWFNHEQGQALVAFETKFD